MDGRLDATGSPVRNIGLLSLAQATMGSNQAILMSIASLTAAGMVAGSPNYIAPEMWRSEPPDRRIDVYSLGAVIFRALAGKAPFGGATIYQLFLQVCNAERPKLTPIRKDLDPAIDAWVAKALCLKPQDRFQSVRELWDEFVRVLLAGSTPNVQKAWAKYTAKKAQAQAARSS